MTMKDALLFPVYGSFTLISLYVLFKYFDKDKISLLFSWYFNAMGLVTTMVFFS